MAGRRHVALVTNTGWSMVRYRGELLRGLLERDWRVSAIADFSEQDTAGLRRLGVDPIWLQVEGAGQSPVHDLGYLVRLARSFGACGPTSCTTSRSSRSSTARSRPSSSA